MTNTEISCMKSIKHYLQKRGYEICLYNINLFEVLYSKNELIEKLYTCINKR